MMIIIVVRSVVECEICTGSQFAVLCVNVKQTAKCIQLIQHKSV